MADGSVRCWGSGESGQLGYGNAESVGGEGGVADAGVVALSGRIASIDTGDDFTCAVNDAGQVRCWGTNRFGQLGLANTNPVGIREVPSQVAPISLSATATAVTAGQAHACALTTAGDIICWGANDYGQLGYGHTRTLGDDQGERPDTWGAVDLGGRATAVSAGAKHTCALLDDGGVACWGRGDAGQLGRGNRDNWGDAAGETPRAAGRVSLGGRAVAVSAGEMHTCAVLADGSARCWGYGWNGRLGTGSTASLGDAGPVNSVPALRFPSPVTSIAAGDQHTCVTLTSGQFSCFGRGTGGRLGRGNELDAGGAVRAEAMPLGQLGPALLAERTSVGADRSCFVAQGSAYCFGNNATLRLLGGGIAGELVGDKPGEAPVRVAFWRPGSR
jgi:alpha-tubulin suppressor-like RCC1 family protein